MQSRPLLSLGKSNTEEIIKTCTELSAFYAIGKGQNTQQKTLSLSTTKTPVNAIEFLIYFLKIMFIIDNEMWLGQIPWTFLLTIIIRKTWSLLLLFPVPSLLADNPLVNYVVLLWIWRERVVQIWNRDLREMEWNQFICFRLYVYWNIRSLLFLYISFLFVVNSSLAHILN